MVFIVDCSFVRSGISGMVFSAIRPDVESSMTFCSGSSGRLPVESPAMSFVVSSGSSDGTFCGSEFMKGASTNARYDKHRRICIVICYDGLQN